MDKLRNVGGIVYAGMRDPVWLICLPSWFARRAHSIPTGSGILIRKRRDGLVADIKAFCNGWGSRNVSSIGLGRCDMAWSMPRVGQPFGFAMNAIHIHRIARVRIRNASCVVVSLMGAFLFRVGAFAASFPLPPDSHPRLMLRSDDIPELRARYNSVAALRNAINAHAEGLPLEGRYDHISKKDMGVEKALGIISKLGTNVGVFTDPDPDEVAVAMETCRKVFEANAFLYLIDPQSNWSKGKQAIELSSNVLRAAVLNGRAFRDYRPSLECGRMLFGAALVYDWCYGIDANRPSGQPEIFNAQAKSTMRTRVMDLCGKLEIAIPDAQTGGAVTGHSCENAIMRNMLGIGIAFWDPDQAADDQLYGKVMSLIAGKIKPARDFAYTAGMHYQGTDYGQGRHVSELWSALLLSKMGHYGLFSDDMQHTLYWQLYARRPDGQMLRDGDIYSSNWVDPGQWWLYRDCFLLSTFLHRDGYLLDELIRQRDSALAIPGAAAEVPSCINEIGPVMELIIRDSGLQPKPHSGLPLSRYFPYPIGTMIARTGWDDHVDPQSDTAVVEMKVGCVKFNNHMHLDSGAFQIYYRGALAIDSGIYQGDENGDGKIDSKTEGYGRVHDGHYYKQTIAHNCMLVYDPDEQVIWHSPRHNNGGQRWPNQGREPNDLEVIQTQGYTSGEVLAHAIGPDQQAPEFTHIKGDITDAYTSKVSSYKRSFVFLNLGQSNVPAVLMVHDWMTTFDAGFDKYWLCHAMEEPVLSADGKQFTINRSGAVGKYGSYSGRLVTSMILPQAENRIVEKVGGQGREFEGLGGVNYPTRPLESIQTEEPGSWRVQIRPKVESRNDVFFNVMQVMDGAATPLAVSRISSPDLEGAVVSDRVVTFSKTGNLIDRPVSFSFAGSGTKKVLMTDMAPGLWMVRKTGSTVVSTIEVKAPSNVLYFSNTPGTYEVSPVSGVSLNPVGNRTVPAGTPIAIEVSSEYGDSSALQYAASGD